MLATLNNEYVYVRQFFKSEKTGTILALCEMLPTNYRDGGQEVICTIHELGNLAEAKTFEVAHLCQTPTEGLDEWIYNGDDEDVYLMPNEELAREWDKLALFLLEEA